MAWIYPCQSFKKKPSTQTSGDLSCKNKNTSNHEIDNKQFQIKFKLDYDPYGHRLEIYQINLVKSYTLFWNKCTKESDIKRFVRTPSKTC